MRLLLTLVLLSNAYASDLIVAAAADLTPLEKPLTLAFQHETGIRVRFSFGASGVLIRQIENGAPYDVFLSANERFVNEGLQRGSLAGPAVLYAYGRLAIWSRSNQVSTLEELANPRFEHIAIANPAHAPYGEAARQALENKGLWRELQPRIVYGENIRQTLQFAETGNADAAIVAWGLVYDRGGVLVPDTLHSPIRQAGAVVKITQRPEDARRFLQFLRSPDGQAILRRFGLFPPGITVGNAQ
jgi:molybdate transport system substrate-binding protein